MIGKRRAPHDVGAERAQASRAAAADARCPRRDHAATRQPRRGLAHATRERTRPGGPAQQVTRCSGAARAMRCSSGSGNGPSTTSSACASATARGIGSASGPRGRMAPQPRPAPERSRVHVLGQAVVLKAVVEPRAPVRRRAVTARGRRCHAGAPPAQARRAQGPPAASAPRPDSRRDRAEERPSDRPRPRRRHAPRSRGSRSQPASRGREAAATQAATGVLPLPAQHQVPDAHHATGKPHRTTRTELPPRPVQRRSSAYSHESGRGAPARAAGRGGSVVPERGRLRLMGRLRAHARSAPRCAGGAASAANGRPAAGPKQSGSRRRSPASPPAPSPALPHPAPAARRRGQQQCGALARALDVWAEQHRQARERGSSTLWPSRSEQRPAHEGHVCVE